MAEIIQLKNIYKTFTDGNKSFNAVENASVSIQKGEIFGIIGFSGAGKSTLVRTINLLGRPTSGSVIVRGKDFLSLRPKELRKERKTIGMIFQHFNLMKSRTVFSNVAFPLKRSRLSKEEIAAKVHKLLELVEIKDKENVYPSQLSGGQKQRVAIARAMVTQPKILLADEPTGALDTETGKQVMEMFRAINKERGTTIIIVTHDPRIGDSTERCIRILDGQIVEG